MSYSRESFYDAVNNCETFDELEEAAKNISEFYSGNIPGRDRNWPVDKQIRAIKAIRSGEKDDFRILTRSFGIRQQAIYLKHYGEK